MNQFIKREYFIYPRFLKTIKRIMYREVSTNGDTWEYRNPNPGFINHRHYVTKRSLRIVLFRKSSFKTKRIIHPIPWCLTCISTQVVNIALLRLCQIQGTVPTNTVIYIHFPIMKAPSKYLSHKYKDNSFVSGAKLQHSAQYSHTGKTSFL